MSNSLYALYYFAIIISEFLNLLETVTPTLAPISRTLHPILSIH